jgi:dTDP-4-dehydrorhamnose 3,5-epimerase
VSSRFDINTTPLEGLVVLTRKPLADARGSFERMFCAVELQAVLRQRTIAQINRSTTSRRGAVRGMHFQRPPFAETKLVTCLRGRIFDVAVDVRQNSGTMLRWRAEVLSEDNHRTLVIPEGFAHGFQTLTDHCELLYLHTAPYSPQHEGALNAQDPALAIDWPEPISEMSPKDMAHAFVGDDFRGVAL